MTHEISRSDSACAPFSDGTTAMRLLPWRSESGKRCYLSPNSEGGLLSRMADEIEAAQTSTAEQVLAGSRVVLGDPNADVKELRFALIRAAEALDDLLLVAESRGNRLPMPDLPEEDEDGDVREADQEGEPILPPENLEFPG